MTQNEIKQLHEVVKKFTYDDWAVVAYPDTIRNNGKTHKVLMVGIGNEKTNMVDKFVFRDSNYTNFEPWLKENFEMFKRKVDQKLAEENLKPKNSL